MLYRLRGKYLVPLVLALGSLSAGSAGAANPASTTTTTGQTLNIQIDSPLRGATVPAGPLTVNGRVAIGPLTVNAAVLYIVDTSGSTDSPADMDCNGDGVLDAGDNFDAQTGPGLIGTTLDCELSGVSALNDSLASVTGISAGLISFQRSALVRDVVPKTVGRQAFTTPDADVDGNGLRDIRQAGRRLSPAGATDFDAALAAMNFAFSGRPAGEQHAAFFLSDGAPQPASSFTTGAGSPLATAAVAGTQVFTYSVGSAGTGCGIGAPLRTIADTTGGTCTEVTRPAALVTVLPGTTPAGIDFVQVFAKGSPPVAATLDALGNFSADTSISGFGPQRIVAQVFATDGTRLFATTNVLAPNPTADLAIQQTSTRDTTDVGGTFTYKLAVSNVGPGTATDVTLTDQFPAELDLVSINTGLGVQCATSFPALSCTLPFLRSGRTVVVRVVVKGTAPAIVTNTARVTAAQTDPVAENNSSSVTVTIRDPSADLALRKTATVSTTLVGNTFNYEIVVLNNGPATANGVVVTDTLPAALTRVSSSASQGRCTAVANAVTCNFRSIASGASASAVITVRAAAAGTLDNLASVTSTSPDPRLDNNSDSASVTIVRRPR